MRQIYEYHPVIGFRFVPGIKARIPHEGGGYLVRTNETGFRGDREYSQALRPGIRRILLFGDSFTAGDGVSNGYRYGDVLERLVPDLEVYNYGLPATGLDQHYLIYREYAQNIAHDLLIIAVFVENIRRVGSRYRHFMDDQGKLVLYGKPYFTLDEEHLTLAGVPPAKAPVNPGDLERGDERYIFVRERFPGLKGIFNKMRRYNTFERLFIETGLKDRALAALGYQPIKEYEDPQNRAWLVMRALIAKWIGDQKKPVLLMPIPLHHYVYGISDPSSYQQRLRSATEEANGTFFDPLPELMSYSLERRKALYFPNDGHLTREGHEALAKALAPVVTGVLRNPAAA